MIKSITIFNIGLSLILWIPTWRKLWKLKRAEEYSLATVLMVALLQWSGLVLALLKHVGPFVWYYVVNGLACTASAGLVYWFQREKPITMKLAPHVCAERGCKVG